MTDLPCLRVDSITPYLPPPERVWVPVDQLSSVRYVAWHHHHWDGGPYSDEFARPLGVGDRVALTERCPGEPRTGRVAPDSEIGTQCRNCLLWWEGRRESLPAHVNRNVPPPASAVVDEILPVKHRPSGPEKNDAPMIYHFGICWWLWYDEHHYEAIGGVDFAGASFGVAVRDVTPL